MNYIKGTQNSVVGTTFYYEVVDLDTAVKFSTPENLQYVWYIFMKLKNGVWDNITKNGGKTGIKVPYKFGEIAKGVTYRLQVHKVVRNKLTGKFESKLFKELELIPSSSKNYSIQKVILFNNGAKDPNKATYKDSLIARAYCIAMYNEEIEFQLWEDDAPEGGHNATINKNNKLPQIFKARVDHKGVAEVKISLLSNEKVLRAIADKYMSSGDKNEGANHEYYVTASFAGKIQGSSQVNVNVANSGTQPKRDSAIFSGTSNQPEKFDKEGKITHAYFLNAKAIPTQNLKVGDSFYVRVKTVNMIGEKIQIRILEKDSWNSDEIFKSGAIKLLENTFTTGILKITPAKFDKGVDANYEYINDPDKKQQHYYIEVTPLTTKAKSVNFGISDENKHMVVENARSVSKVADNDTKKTDSTCVCKEQYADLIWGGKVSCEFRKKVMLISKKNAIDPNNLMAAMAHETGGTFDPRAGTFKKHKDETREGYVGLLQIGKDAAIDIGITRTELLGMNQIIQLDYVEKYLNLPLVKGKLNTLTDFYLAVLFPVDCGKGNQLYHVVFDNSLPISYKNGKPIKNLNYWRNVSYSANPAFHKEGKKEKGITYVWEIAENIKIWYDKGALAENKIQEFSCQTIQQSKQTVNTNSTIVYFDDGIIEDRRTIVSQTTIKILEKAAISSSNDKVIITSTIRFTKRQAEAMYSNESNGKHIRYASPGRAVLNVYKIGKANGQSKEKILSDMDTKIKELSLKGQRVSKHCVSDEVYANNNILDVSYSRGIKNPKDFINELAKDSAVTKILHPLSGVASTGKIIYDTGEAAIHIEIKN